MKLLRLARTVENWCSCGQAFGRSTNSLHEFSKGRSEIKVSRLTLHALTCIHVLEQMLDVSFKVLGEKDASATIMCDGICQKRRQS